MPGLPLQGCQSIQCSSSSLPAHMHTRPIVDAQAALGGRPGNCGAAGGGRCGCRTHQGALLLGWLAGNSPCHVQRRRLLCTLARCNMPSRCLPKRVPDPACLLPLQGITRYWDVAGEPATEAKVQRFLQASGAHPPLSCHAGRAATLPGVCQGLPDLWAPAVCWQFLALVRAWLPCCMRPAAGTPLQRGTASVWGDQLVAACTPPLSAAQYPDSPLCFSRLWPLYMPDPSQSAHFPLRGARLCRPPPRTARPG